MIFRIPSWLSGRAAMRAELASLEPPRTYAERRSGRTFYISVPVDSLFSGLDVWGGALPWNNDVAHLTDVSEGMGGLATIYHAKFHDARTCGECVEWIEVLFPRAIHIWSAEEEVQDGI